MVEIIPAEEISYYRRQQLADLLDELAAIHGKESILQFDLEGYGAFTFEPGRTVADIRESNEAPVSPIQAGSNPDEKPQGKAKS